MHTTRKSLAVVVAGLTLVSCNTWSTASVTPRTEGPAAAVLSGHDAETTKAPADIIVMANDMPERRYRVLGDIEVTVNKTTIFNDDPTPDMVIAKLREEAAKLHADAIVLVRYGTVGASRFSTASLTGHGRAVAFVD